MQVLQEQKLVRPAGQPAAVQNCSRQFCEPLIGSNSLAQAVPDYNLRIIPVIPAQAGIY